MNIAAILEEQALARGDASALVDPRGTITFAELNAAAAAAAARFQAAGVGAGMRALVLCPMSIALYTTLVALFRMRVTAVFVDPSAGRSTLDACLRRVRPDAFIGTRKAHLLRLTSPAIRSIRVKMTIDGWAPGAYSIDLGAAGRAAGSPARCEADEPAIITFTSGSTGAPKAAVRSHGFLIAQHRALVGSLSLRAGEIDLTTLPIFVLANLASGVTSVIPDADLRAPGAIDPPRVIAQIGRSGPTRIAASPAFLDRLADEALRTGRPLSSFRRIFTGGAPVFPRTVDALAAAAPEASIVAVYGSTEAEPIASIDCREITADDRIAMQQGAGLLTGPPESSVELRILPDRFGTPCGPWAVDELERLALPSGEIGEIVVTGDHVLSGYLDGAGDEETKIAVGDRVWHRTGDAGCLDRDGRLWLMGRCSERVSDEHGVVYPFAVECAASGVPGVVRCAFVRHNGRRVLVVERQGGKASPVDILRQRLAWAQLADIITVPRIPVDRRHNAKVDYPALRKTLAHL